MLGDACRKQIRNSPQSPVAALLFDLGGVLFEISFDRAFAAWATMSSLSPDEMRRTFSFDEAYRRHERGEMAQRDYFDHLRTTLRLSASDAAIAAGWNAIFGDEIAPTVELVRRARGVVPCFAFSNSNPTHRAAWMAKYRQLLEAFDRVFVSSDIGRRKPEPEAFAFIAASTRCAPGSILFFDDTLENVTGALAAGLQAVHVREPMDVARALQNVAGVCPASRGDS